MQHGPCLAHWQALSSFSSSSRGEEHWDAQGVLRECSGGCSGVLGDVQGDDQGDADGGMLRRNSENAQGDAQEGVERPASQHPPLEQRSSGLGGRWQPQVPRLSPRLRGGDGAAEGVPAPPGHTYSPGWGSVLQCSSSSPAPPGELAEGMPPFTLPSSQRPLRLLQARLPGRRAG